VQKRMTIALAVAALLTAGCARGIESSASGEVIGASDAAKTVVLYVDNQNSQPVELRTVLDGRSAFVGAVQANDSATILLDPTLFPAGFLYLVAVPADGRGRAIAGPLSASKGDKIKFTVAEALNLSNAIVLR